jgi:hypothetical protein
LTFGAGCKLSIIGESAFEFCQSLQSICIPPLVPVIPKRCFAHCMNLWRLTFDRGCIISTLGESAFSFCSSLESICIPSSIETISVSCFGDCESLVTVILESGCKLSVDCLSDLRSECEVTLN